MERCCLLLTFLLLAACLPAAAQLRPFRAHDRVGYQDASGSVIIPAIYEAGSDMHEGFAIIIQNNKRGFLDRQGTVSISCRFEDAAPFTESLACVQLDGRYGYIDTAGKWIIQPQFENAFSFSNGLARVCLQQKWGMINRAGAMVVPAIYHRLCDISAGLIAATPDGARYGYLNATGTPVIPFRFLMGAPFDEGTRRALVHTSRGPYYIDARGKLVAKAKDKHEEEQEREREAGIIEPRRR